ncbi:hypothetical protein SAMN06273572_10223 [Monaibacterium marinum]|uniref:Uncharacterized protein n=1 Tax=Pontivivens marinum TaxID=1690039 RepID=A0A2C9CQ65_9RHOB|nr:hypothetical protein [Monaibacterium marinum]SOH93347.1 hypothetical protein SAMN06273572_10223 [Monaibacterium marinum]
MIQPLQPYDAVRLTGVYRDIDSAHADGLGSVRMLDLIQHGTGSDSALIASTETRLTLSRVMATGGTLEIATGLWLSQANRVVNARAQAAAMLCSDIAFRRWLRGRSDCPQLRTDIPKPERTATQLRAILQIRSRRELSTNAAAATRWDLLRETFERATGRINDGAR